MKIVAKTPEAYQLLHEGALALSEIESAGIRIDVNYCQRQHRSLERKINHQIDKLCAFNEVKLWKDKFKGKFNLDSDKQLSSVLFGELKLEPSRVTDKGNASVDAKSLEDLQLPFVQELVMYRQLCKAKDTYLSSIMRETVNEYLHPSFNLHTVKTYRSCVAKGSLVLAVRDFDKEGIPIEQIKVGDYVYCFDNNLQPAIKKVLWAGKTGHRKVIRIHWKGGKGRLGYLDVTPEHLIRHVSGDYIQARHLVGDLRKANENKHAPKIRVLSVLRRGDRLYFTHHLGKNGGGIHEHRLIYSKLVGWLESGSILHHKDKNHLNHALSNLEKMTLSEHSKLHVRDTLLSDKARKNSVLAVKRRWKSGAVVVKYGQDCYNYLDLSKFRCLRVLAKLGGKLPKGHLRGGYDFNTFKKYLRIHGICPSAVKLRYDRIGKYISKGRLLELSKHGRAYVGQKLGINFYKLKKLYEQYGIDTARLYGNQFGRFVVNNHTITKIEYLEKEADVYDIEVEDYHNFIANEICVHNSSSSPNFQNIPVRMEEIKKIVRQAFIPRLGHRFGGLDYAGIEVRANACINKDPELLRYVKDPGSDMHRDMAMEIYLLDQKQITKSIRYCAKNKFVFPQFYGDWWLSCAKSLWEAIGIMSLKTMEGIPLKEHLRSKGIKGLGTVDAKYNPSRGSFYEHVKEVERKFWNDKFAVYTQWKKEWMREYERKGYFDMLTGFRCSGIMAKNDVLNYHGQGIAFHCLLWSLIKMHKWLKKEGMRSLIIGQIHDEMTMDVHAEEMNLVLMKAKQIMCEDIRKEWEWIVVPLDVEAEFAPVDKSWYEKKKVEIPGMVIREDF